MTLHLNGTSIDIVARRLNDGGLLIQLDGASHVVHAEEEPSGTRLTIGTSTCLLSNEHDPSKLTSLSTGKIIRYLVEDGAHINANEAYAEIEVMKMVMTLLTPAAGTISLEMPEGSVLAPGNLIARLDLDDPASVRTATPFEGQWPPLGPPVVKADGVEKRFLEAISDAENILSGYPNNVESAVTALYKAVLDPTLGLVRWNEAYGVVSSRIPTGLATQLENIADDCAADLEEAKKTRDNDSDAITSAAMSEFLETMSREIESCTEDKDTLAQLLEPLQEVAKDHVDGVESFARSIVKQLINRYLQVEEQFEGREGMTEQEIIDALRRANASDLHSVVDLVLSHNGLKKKADLLMKLLCRFVASSPDLYRQQLRRLASLHDRRAIGLSLRAQQILEHSLLGELRAIVARALSGLDISISESPIIGSTPGAFGNVGRRLTVTEGLFAGLTNLTSPSMQTASIEDRISMLVEAPAAVEDALAALLLDNNDSLVAQRALKTYIKRLYHPYTILDPQLDQTKNGLMIASWAFEDQASAESLKAKECIGGAMVINNLGMIKEGLEAMLSSKATSALKAGLENGVLHVVLAGENDASLGMSPEAYQQMDRVTLGMYEQSDSEDADIAIDPRKVAAAFLAQVSSLSSDILSAGFSTVSLMSRRGSLSPMRTVLQFSLKQNQFVLDPVTSLMEPPTATSLELAKLSAFKKAVYSCSRNRQWHIYSVDDERKISSSSLKRLFVRGLIRQMGRPDLLAATYSGNSAAAATAAMMEIEDSLQFAVIELERAGK